MGFGNKVCYETSKNIITEHIVKNSEPYSKVGDSVQIDTYDELSIINYED
ncbi:9985_t:CDS:2 [Funneliformis mosseae]|uniref:9985_t:CDS:1 n=1 Tax=Funneliformis mosseae TaxID=27381 RepID=A0A9N9CQ45_FUNMO|nr:9985_t:CDS:2 [Funneliformis mosseae]